MFSTDQRRNVTFLELTVNTGLENTIRILKNPNKDFFSVITRRKKFSAINFWNMIDREPIEVTEQNLDDSHQ